MNRKIILFALLFIYQYLLFTTFRWMFYIFEIQKYIQLKEYNLILFMDAFIQIANAMHFKNHVLLIQ